MTLKIVNNNGTSQVHSVRIDDGSIEIIEIEAGSRIQVSVMEEIFPGFEDTLKSATDTISLLEELTLLNSEYVWAHVSGKL